MKTELTSHQRRSLTRITLIHKACSQQLPLPVHWSRTLHKQVLRKSTVSLAGRIHRFEILSDTSQPHQALGGADMFLAPEFPTYTTSLSLKPACRLLSTHVRTIGCQAKSWYHRMCQRYKGTLEHLPLYLRVGLTPCPVRATAAVHAAAAA